MNWNGRNQFGDVILVYFLATPVSVPPCGYKLLSECGQRLYDDVSDCNFMLPGRYVVLLLLVLVSPAEGISGSLAGSKRVDTI